MTAKTNTKNSPLLFLHVTITTNPVCQFLSCDASSATAVLTIFSSREYLVICANTIGTYTYRSDSNHHSLRRRLAKTMDFSYLPCIVVLFSDPNFGTLCSIQRHYCFVACTCSSQNSTTCTVVVVCIRGTPTHQSVGYHAFPMLFVWDTLILSRPVLDCSHTHTKNKKNL